MDLVASKIRRLNDIYDPKFGSFENAQRVYLCKMKCPSCGIGIWLSDINRRTMMGYETKCRKCGTRSQWDCRLPVPVLGPLKKEKVGFYAVKIDT